MRRMMMVLSILIVSIAWSASAEPPAPAGPPSATGIDEELKYEWRLRGPLSWVAAVAFPTSGTGNLRTSTSTRDTVETELVIRARKGSDFYRYESEIEQDSIRTLMSYHGYAWGDKEKEERTFFDYVKKIARIFKKSYKSPDETRERPIPEGPLRDVLTGIYYLRINSDSITKPINNDIYSDGTMYPVQFKPLGTKSMTFEGKKVAVRGFEITARPGDQSRWPGGVEVWFTTDSRKIPVQISINQTLAALQLDLASIEKTGSAPKPSGFVPPGR